MFEVHFNSDVAANKEDVKGNITVEPNTASQVLALKYRPACDPLSYYGDGT